MSRTFHPFPRLPAELRLAIWKLAVRPGGMTLPGVHFFGVATPRKSERAKSCVNHALALRDSTFDSEICLVGPLWEPMSAEGQFIDKLEPASWIDNNPSTYLIDSGLWMACKESKLVIAQAFQQQQRDGTRSRSFRRMPLAYQNKANIPDDARDRFITVFPRQDLFCFQAHDWDVLDGISFLLNNFGGIRHMAVEYDPKWGIEVNYPGYYEWGLILQNLSNIAIDVAWESGVDFFFFIDYRTKRRHHVPTKEQADKPAELTFYHQGRRFIDVDIHGEDSIWEQDYEVAEDELSGNMFVDALQNAASAIVHRVPMAYEVNFYLPYFGILACEEE